MVGGLTTVFARRVPAGFQPATAGDATAVLRRTGRIDPRARDVEIEDLLKITLVPLNSVVGLVIVALIGFDYI